MERPGGHAGEIIDSLAAVEALLAPRFTDASQERLCVAYLDSRGGLIDLSIHQAEGEGQIDFPVREIIARALGLGSAALILAHNHPSGDASPSSADIEATRIFIQAARPLGLTVRDHLVFGRDAVTSFRARGLL